MPTFDKSLYSLIIKHIHQINETHSNRSVVFGMYVCGHFHLLFKPPTHSLLCVCFTGKCVQRLPVWMLLLPIILAPDLQGAKEESGIPRLLFLFLSQLHSSGLPAGGALGLTGTSWPPEWIYPLICSDLLLLKTLRHGHVSKKMSVFGSVNQIEHIKKCCFSLIC